MVSKWSQNGAKMVPNGVTEASRRGNFEKSVTDSELLRNTCSIFAPKVAQSLEKKSIRKVMKKSMPIFKGLGVDF